ncbi:Phosphatidylserine decarboxylase [hydrothermal vent metagenome]|uniref:Phosphatidylserine decarboxylase n=1 Tax=hydrothermal vent metagenome TaxID=652676 RepID=A0A3B0QRR7_9ZZZZ
MPGGILQVAREGYPFILIALALNVITGWQEIYWLFGITCALTLWVVWFFRDPVREIPSGGAWTIVSPADGVVIKAETVQEDKLLNAEAIKVSIFMNVFNVHVNRTPIYGRVIKVVYSPGKFFNASFDKASLYNEQNAILMEGYGGRRIVFTQIAGLIARRIVCRAKEGMELNCGERFGLIRFGSRLDVYLPLDTEIAVKVGDKVNAGTSIIGRWHQVQ